MVSSTSCQTYHPAATFRSPPFVVDLVRDLEKIPRILSWPADGSALAAVHWNVATKLDAQHVLDSMPKNELITLDVETTIPSDEEKDEETPHGQELLCFSLTTVNGKPGYEREITWAFPRDVLDGLVWPNPSQYSWGFQSGQFDQQAIRRRYGVILPVSEDSLLQSYSLDERPGNHSLERLSMEYLGAGKYKEATKGYVKHMDQLDESLLIERNAKDTAYTYRLINFFTPRQVEDDVRSMYKTLLIPAANIFADMQYRGIKIDREMLGNLVFEWAPRYLGTQRRMQDTASQYGWAGALNPGSPKQVSSFLQDYLDIYWDGAPSVARDLVEEIEDEHEWVGWYLDWKRDQHIINHYVKPLAASIKDDGRCHHSILQHGTVTGRRSNKNPPMQTIPKAYTVGDDLARIRSVFVPTNDDYVLWEADYRQIEAWLCWAHSDDPNMYADLTEIQPWTNGKPDFHGATAVRALHKDPFAPDWDTHRQQAKKVNFGLLYGEGAKGLASKRKGLNTTVQVAQQYLDQVLRRYRGYDAWMKRMQRLAQSEGELVSASGRKRRFKLVQDTHALRQAVNFPIQSLAGDYTLSSLIELYWQLQALDCHVLVESHDSLLFEISKRHETEALALIVEVMEKPRFDGFPSVKVDLKTGPNWFNMKGA